MSTQPIARRTLATYMADKLQAGGNISHITKEVAAYLLEQHQTQDVELLVRDVEEILESKYGIVVARIQSASPLDATTRTLVVDALKAKGAKHVVIVEESVDADLLGGVVIETPSSVFDSSLKTKVRTLAMATKE